MHGLLWKDRPAAAQSAVGHALPGTAQAAVEQISPGEAQAAAGQTPLGTVQAVVQYQRHDRYRTGCCRSDSTGTAQAAVDQTRQVQHRLL